MITLFRALTFSLLFVGGISKADDNKNTGTAVRKELKFKLKSYDDAENSQDFLRFVGSSTKFKILTTKFEGYAKEFTVSYEKRDLTVSNVLITIATSQLDTNSDSRNEKMFNKCLLVDKYPLITGKLKQPIVLGAIQEGESEILLRIKDRELVRKIKYRIVEKNEKFQIYFSTDFSFIEAGIADPSIAIAKVAEIFLIEGNITLE